MQIPLGFEIGTGHAVSIPLRHLAVAGLTQLSGKTSTLEALVSRAGLRCVAFVTKRGETGFQEFKEIPPYFKERTDWQSVEAMLEAAMRERLKFERPWIIRVSKGAQSLTQVHEHVRHALEKAHGLQQSVYEVLNAYLEIVLPQIDALPYRQKLELVPGINVMNLRKYTAELQALVIRSVLDWVYEREEKVVTIIPEAWEFIPQGRSSPVVVGAELLIRKGGATENFLWIDSQDLAAVDKRILKSVGVYILGVQREENEVIRTLKHIGISPRPKPEEIRGLGLGQFFVCFDRVIKKVYVQPTWADPLEAKAAALSGGGIVPPPTKRRKIQNGNSKISEAQELADEEATIAVQDSAEAHAEAALDEVSEQEEEDSMWKEKYEEAMASLAEKDKQITLLQAQIGSLQDHLSQLAGEAVVAAIPGTSERALDAQTGCLPAVRAPQRPEAQTAQPPSPNGLEEIWQYVKARLEQEPKLLRLAMVRPEIEIAVKPTVLELAADSLQGRIARLITEKYFEQARTLAETVAELKRRGVDQAPPNVWRTLQSLAQSGFLLREAGKVYKAAPDVKITKTQISAQA
jgi:hypothetical protein